MGNAKYDYEMLKRTFDHLSVLANIKLNLNEVGMIIEQDVLAPPATLSSLLSRLMT